MSVGMAWGSSNGEDAGLVLRELVIYAGWRGAWVSKTSTE